VAGPILVTGADGFVGPYLLAELGGEGIPLEADVTDAKALARELSAASPRAVVHLAGHSSVADSWQEGGEVWWVNVVGTVCLLDAVRAVAPQARVLAVSTGEVYGQAEQLPTTEEAAIAPVSPYAASKAAAELACAQAQHDGLDVVVARAFQHEGPGRDERFAIGSWTRQIARLEEQGGGTLAVGDLSVRRDITDVRDVCRAYRLLLDSAVPAGTYNVASGQAVSLQDVLDRLLAMARRQITVEADPGRSRRTDLTVICGDASKLAAATGWAPTIPLDQTLTDALEAARAAATEKVEV
jgi:GDP-4-dehydro-6-deoxy-D-mannose reductase